MKRTSLAILIIVIVALLIGAGFWLMANRNSNTNNANPATNNANSLLTNQSNLNANRTVTNSNPNTNTSVNVNTNTNSAANSNTNTNTNSAPVAISITSAGFSPRTLTVNAGTTVTWTNNDTVTHYIAPDDHPSHFKYAGVWDDDSTGQISRGQTYSNPFLLEGTYTYHDHLNPSTTGTIIVQ